MAGIARGLVLVREANDPAFCLSARRGGLVIRPTQGEAADEFPMRLGDAEKLSHIALDLEGAAENATPEALALSSEHHVVHGEIHIPHLGLRMVLIVEIGERNDHHRCIAHGEKETLREFVETRLEAFFEIVFDREPALLGEGEVLVSFPAREHKEAPVLLILARGRPKARFEHAIEHFRGNGLSLHVAADAATGANQVVNRALVGGHGVFIP